MKRTLYKPFTILIVFFAGVLSVKSQIPDLGIFKKTANSNHLDVRLRPTEDVVCDSYSGGVFTVRFPSSYVVPLSIVPNSAQNSYAFAGPVDQADG